jgi:hypothetical protein
MITPYVYADLGQKEPNNPGDWWGETVVLLRYQRPALGHDVKQAVDAFKDASGDTAYKHFVPWDRIFRTLENACMNKTRNECHTLLNNVLGNLQIKDNSGVNPTKHRAEYDSWFTWAVEAICDWPKNVYCGPSYGDHGGTTVDMPKPGYSPALRLRLDTARHQMQEFFALKIDYQEKFV